MKLRYAGNNDSETVMDVTVRNSINWIEIMLATLLILSICVALYFYIQHRRHSNKSTRGHDDSAQTDANQPVYAAENDHQEKYRTTRLSDKECRAPTRNSPESRPANTPSPTRKPRTF